MLFSKGVSRLATPEKPARRLGVESESDPFTGVFTTDRAPRETPGERKSGLRTPFGVTDLPGVDFFFGVPRGVLLRLLYRLMFRLLLRFLFGVLDLGVESLLN